MTRFVIGTGEVAFRTSISSLPLLPFTAVTFSVSASAALGGWPGVGASLCAVPEPTIAALHLDGKVSLASMSVGLQDGNFFALLRSCFGNEIVVFAPVSGCVPSAVLTSRIPSYPMFAGLPAFGFGWAGL